jgi:hypothetical protein
MKIEQTTASFKPVTVIFETDAELELTVTFKTEAELAFFVREIGASNDNMSRVFNIDTE